MLHAAIRAADLDLIRACLDQGASPNALDEHGDTALREAILRIDEPQLRRDVVYELLERGADPKLHTKDGGGPLFSAMTQYDPVVMRWLLELGADPNLENDMGEPLFDWSDFYYRVEEYDYELPEESTAEDRASSVAWCAFLDRLAIKFGKKRPICLSLIAQFGARGWPEGVKWESTNSHLWDGLSS